MEPDPTSRRCTEFGSASGLRRVRAGENFGLSARHLLEFRRFLERAVLEDMIRDLEVLIVEQLPPFSVEKSVVAEERDVSTLAEVGHHERFVDELVLGCHSAIAGDVRLHRIQVRPWVEFAPALVRRAVPALGESLVMSVPFETHASRLR